MKTELEKTVETLEKAITDLKRLLNEGGMNESAEPEIERFSGEWSKRLPEKEGRKVIEEGTRRGQSEPVKDTYWACYENDGKCYISLNDDPSTVWETSREDMEAYY